MSTIKANNLTNIAGDTTVSMTGGSLVTNDVRVSSINSGPIGGFRNRIINGAMEIDQRNAGAAVSLNNTGSYINDRWGAFASGGSGTGTASVQRIADAPPGFTNSLRYTVTNAKTPASSDVFFLYQLLEGQNITDFAYGTASAKTVTLSFWVKSSLIGNFSARLFNGNGSNYRSYVFNYTINAANTWQYVTISAPGDTGQVPASDNTLGYGVLFDLGSGSTYQTSTLNSWQTGNFYRTATSTNLISTLNATFQVTGVQLELGTQATPFERRIYSQELSLCQRYYELCTLGTSSNPAGTYTRWSLQYKQTKRANPTNTYTIVSSSNGNQPTVNYADINGASGYANGTAIGDYTIWTVTSAAEL